jgi:hypothetical protein
MNEVTFRNPYPREYSKRVADRICQRLMLGESIRDICNVRDPKYPTMPTFAKWLASNEEFRTAYAFARQVGAEVRIDEVFEIADNTSDDHFIDANTGLTKINNEAIARSRVRIDTRKWYAQKMLPNLYGDKETIKHDVTDGFMKMLQAATNRDSVLPSKRIAHDE